MKFKCPQCQQNFKASKDAPLPGGAYDLCCSPHSRIRFNKEHQLIEYNLYAGEYGLAAYKKEYLLNYQQWPYLEHDETFLIKDTDNGRSRVLELPFFLSFETQEELDSLIPRLLNLKAFS
jgi:hypothetical protein